MYLCTTNSTQECSTALIGKNGHESSFVNNALEDTRRGSGPVIHLDLDGGEEPAVTTDVMFSGKLVAIPTPTFLSYIILNFIMN